jgi:flagellar hook protein FlgE
MIDSIYIAMTGLNGHQRGLRTISNNVANMNTPGFKGSSVNFNDALGGSQGSGYSTGDAGGQGLVSSQTLLDLRSGERRQTGRDLDLSLQGDGFFLLHDDAGQARYTRAGAFEFNSDGNLVSRGNGMQVMGRDATGALAPVSLNGLRVNPPKATADIVFTGNLSTTGTEHTVDSVVVYDQLGGAHTLRVEMTNNSTVTDGSWNIKVFEGTTEVGSGAVVFADGRAVASNPPLSLALALQNADPANVTFTFGADVTSFSSGTVSTLGMKSQDGHAVGQITGLKFNDQGHLEISYSNGEKADGPRLALAQIRDEANLEAVGNSLFAYQGNETPLLREGGDDLKVSGQSLELSNVDLTEEFSSLILMQRGFQASSQVLSTANDMLQELFDMKGRR